MTKWLKYASKISLGGVQRNCEGEKYYFSPRNCWKLPIGYRRLRNNTILADVDYVEWLFSDSPDTDWNDRQTRVKVQGQGQGEGNFKNRNIS